MLGVDVGDGEQLPVRPPGTYVTVGGDRAALVGDGGLGGVALVVGLGDGGAAGEDDVALVVHLRAAGAVVAVGDGDGGGAALAVRDGQRAVGVIDQGHAAGGHV